ncbi:MAG: response regulator [Deltaproteobacteria bacterium]|nr:response regulator [Deltaproteobacteria bacterium]
MADVAPHRVLLVEDNPDHTFLTQLVLEGAGVAHEIVPAVDGQDAIDRLRGTGPHEGEALRPALVLLDIKLPRVDGYQVLRLMRADPVLRLVPVVILTTSNNPADIEQSLALGASDYVIKPIGLNEFERKLCGVLQYWLSVSDLGRGRPA